MSLVGSIAGLINSLVTKSYYPDLSDPMVIYPPPGLVCDGALDSEFVLTKVCAVGWCLAQLYMALPIMLGGEDAFNILGLFNAFCISALPLMTAPLMAILDSLNGQALNGKLMPATGDLIAVSLAYKAGTQAMAVTTRETSSAVRTCAIWLLKANY